MLISGFACSRSRPSRAPGTSRRRTANILIGRYRRPQPRTELVIPVRNFAQGAIDVSDGLVGDIEKLAQVSHVGAVIEADKVPLSPAARKALAREPKLLATLLTAGDDYEIVAAVPELSVSAFEGEASNKGVSVTAIGRMVEGKGEARLVGADGRHLDVPQKGYVHF